MTSPTTPERSTAYGVIAICIVLLLAAVWPNGAPGVRPAEAAQPIVIVATPTPNPAWTPRPELPAREAPPALPTEAPAVAAVESAGTVAAPATMDPPQSQIIYESDGSLRLPGVDGPAVEANPPPADPISAETRVQLAADAALYKSLPVAGEPPADGGQPLMHPWHRGGK
jgi:hypothetical protein